MKNKFILVTTSETSQFELSNPETGVTYSMDFRTDIKLMSDGSIKTYRQFIPNNQSKEVIKLNFDSVDTITFLEFKEFLKSYLSEAHLNTTGLFYYDWVGTGYRIKLNTQTLESIINSRVRSKLDGHSFNLDLHVIDENTVGDFTIQAERAVSGNTVTINYESTAGLGIIVENIPANINVYSYGDAEWDSNNRTLTWQFTQTSGSVSYVFNAPVDTYTVSGEVSLNNLIETITGDTDLVSSTYLVNTLVRSLQDNDTPWVKVYLTATPVTLTTGYTITETLPANFVASEISDNGVWDGPSRTITWTFADNNPRTVLYQIRESAITTTGNHSLTGDITDDVPTTVNTTGATTFDFTNSGKTTSGFLYPPFVIGQSNIVPAYGFDDTWPTGSAFAYNELTAYQFTGSSVRTDAPTIDVFQDGSLTFGYGIGYFDQNEYLTWSCYVAESGDYKIGFRYSCAAQAELRLFVSQTNPTTGVAYNWGSGVITGLGATGGFGIYTIKQNFTVFPLVVGNLFIKVLNTQAVNFNLDYIQVVKQ